MEKIMFEAKVEEKMKSQTIGENDKEFLMDARMVQICNVIDSLEEEEFVSLQKSIMHTFGAVEDLIRVVKEELKRGETYTNVYNALNEIYLESSESSFYYREQYVNLCNFLSSIRDELNQEGSRNELLDTFTETIEQSFYSEKYSVLKAIFTRNELKSRIAENTKLKEIGKVDVSSQLCEQIRKLILLNIDDDRVCEELKHAHVSFIETALVQPICELRDYLPVDEKVKDHIASILETREKNIIDMSDSFSQKISVTMNILKNKKLYSLSTQEQDETLDKLIELLEQRPKDTFTWEIHFLKQLTISSNYARRRFYSGKKVRYQSMMDETTYHYETIFQFEDTLSNSVNKYLKQRVADIDRKVTADINLEFKKILRQIPRVYNIVGLYPDDKILRGLLTETVMKDIDSMKEYIALKGIFSQFFERLLNGVDKKKFLEQFDQAECTIDSDKQCLMDAIATLVWDTQMTNHLVIDLDQDQLDLYGELQGMRKVQEDDVIDAIIHAPVYQKTSH